MTRRRRAPLERGDEATQKARAALRSRAGQVLRAAAFEDVPRCPEAAYLWSTRAWSELAAVPAMSSMSLAVLRSSSSSDLDALGAVMQMGVDEVRHTELSREVAHALGGYVETVPPGFAFEPARLGDPNDMPLPFWIVACGCVSETVSLALMRARLPHTTHPGIHAALAAVVQDEAVHQRVGWSLAARVLPDASTTTKRELARYAEAAFSVMRASFGTKELPPRRRREERRVRAVTAARGLGACPPDDADAVVDATIDDVIAPRLRALGVPVRTGS